MTIWNLSIYTPAAVYVLKSPSMNTFRGSSPDPHRTARAADRILAKSMPKDKFESSDKTQTQSQSHDILLDSIMQQNDNSNDPLYAPASLPSVTRHMPCYARRSAQRFRPAQGMSCHDAPNALELRFVERSLGKYSGETDMSMIDVQQVFWFDFDHRLPQVNGHYNRVSMSLIVALMLCLTALSVQPSSQNDLIANLGACALSQQLGSSRQPNDTRFFFKRFC
jgi:hypothetical protein